MDIYNILIIFIIFVLVHKIVALIVVLNIQLTSIRYTFNLIEPFFIIYFLTFFKFNTYLKSLLLLFLLAPINYWLCDRGLIYSVIDNNKQNNKIIQNVSFYGDVTINILVLSYAIFFVKNIFFNN
jgi:hypothetical protein